MKRKTRDTQVNLRADRETDAKKGKHRNREETQRETKIHMEKNTEP